MNTRTVKNGKSPKVTVDGAKANENLIVEMTLSEMPLEVRFLTDKRYARELTDAILDHAPEVGEDETEEVKRNNAIAKMFADDASIKTMLASRVKDD